MDKNKREIVEESNDNKTQTKIAELFALLEDEQSDDAFLTSLRRHAATGACVADLEEVNGDGETLLFRASKLGRHHAVKSLVERGVNLESRDPCNFTPLHSAAIYGRFR